MLITGPIPPLRYDLEAIPITHEGQPFVTVSDVLGLQKESVIVPVGLMAIASLFDGKKTIKNIQAELTRQKVILSEIEIQTMIDQLNKHFLLETPAAAEKRKQLLENFKKSPIRPMAVKTRGLPENPLDLAGFMGKFYTEEKGPGKMPEGDPQGAPPIGLVSPHIDLFRGGPLYAWSYAELAKREKPDVIIALGVAHLSPKSPWVMTQKSYETPYGPMEVDMDLYEAIRKELWYDPLEEEWVHAKEHSLEFQALWLKYIWRQDSPRWVPILCSSFERYCTDKAPSTIPSIEDTINRIGNLLLDLSKKGKKVMVLAGIDLAHVGKRFGDKKEMTPEWQKEIENLDRLSIKHAFQLNADEFFKSGVGEGAWRKVCGLSTFYTSLRWIKALANGNKPEPKLLGYDQQPDPAGGIVSFISAVF